MLFVLDTLESDQDFDAFHAYRLDDRVGVDAISHAIGHPVMCVANADMVLVNCEDEKHFSRVCRQYRQPQYIPNPVSGATWQHCRPWENGYIL